MKYVISWTAYVKWNYVHLSFTDIYIWYLCECETYYGCFISFCKYFNLKLRSTTKDNLSSILNIDTTWHRHTKWIAAEFSSNDIRTCGVCISMKYITVAPIFFYVNLQLSHSCNIYQCSKINYSTLVPQQIRLILVCI